MPVALQPRGRGSCQCRGLYLQRPFLCPQSLPSIAAVSQVPMQGVLTASHCARLIRNSSVDRLPSLSISWIRALRP